MHYPKATQMHKAIFSFLSVNVLNFFSFSFVYYFFRFTERGAKAKGHVA